MACSEVNRSEWRQASRDRISSACAWQRADESVAGKWKENKKGAAVIRWEDGWTTKLSKKGDSYRKVAFEKGKQKAAVKGEAEKIE